MIGSVSISDIYDISNKVSGAAITIIATMVMAISLESFGFFHWIAAKLLEKARGSGVRLFWLTNLLCFIMTLFFNNDGSILITTPILILLLKHLGLKNHEKIPYLISGALIATASSAPIGVSNIVNLISLKMIGLDLYLNTILIFVPGVLGLIFLSLLLFAILYKEIPKKLSKNAEDLYKRHPLQEAPDPIKEKRKAKMMKFVLLFVFVVRLCLFAASYVGFPVPLVAVIGSTLLISWRWYYLNLNPYDVLKKTPWHIFLFAFSMYVVIYGLHNIGLTNYLVEFLKPFVSQSLIQGSFIMGVTLTLLSNFFNNHPALMIGTLTLIDMHLDPVMLKTVYLANIIGSDIGSLILPIGTLATLIWMHILKQEHIKISWKKYLQITLLVIPPTVFLTIYLLYIWVSHVYR